jgi:hypothetical protein
VSSTTTDIVATWEQLQDGVQLVAVAEKGQQNSHKRLLLTWHPAFSRNSPIRGRMATVLNITNIIFLSYA